MNRKWWKFLFLLPVIGCTLYAGGYAAQFIKNYQEWTSRSEERRVGKECTG